MATISIPDPLLKRLEANAAARRLTLDEYLREVAGEDDVHSAPDVTKRLAAWNTFVSRATKWAADHLPPGHVVDDSRDAIYEGRGE